MFIIHVPDSYIHISETKTETYVTKNIFYEF